MALQNPLVLRGPGDVPGLENALAILGENSDAGLQEKQAALDSIAASYAAQAKLLQDQAAKQTATDLAIAELRGLVTGAGSSSPVNTAPVSISGSPASLVVGQAYTLTAGTWTGASTAPRAYKMLQGTVELLSFVGLNFTVPDAAAAGKIRIAEYVVSPGGTPASLASAEYSVNATAAFPAMLSPPYLTGTFAANSDVTINHGQYTGTVTAWTPYEFWIGGALVYSGTAATFRLLDVHAGLTLYATELPLNAAGLARAPMPTPNYTISGGSRPFIVPGDPKPGWYGDGNYNVNQLITFDFGGWSNNPDFTKDRPGLMRNGAVVADAVFIMLADGTGAQYLTRSVDQGTSLVATIIRGNANGDSAQERTGPRTIGAPIAGGGVVTPPGSNGSISTSLEVQSGSYALTTLGTRGWWVRDGSNVMNQKSGGEMTTRTALGAGMQTDTTSDLGNVLAWASGGTPTGAGSNQVGGLATAMATMWQTVGAGDNLSILANTTQRVYALFLSIYNGSLQVVISLGDGSAATQTVTLHSAAIGATAPTNIGVNRVLYITFKADTTTTLNVAITNATTTANSHIMGGYIQ